MKTILVPTDFSANADNALTYACEINKKLNVTIEILHSYYIPVVVSDGPVIPVSPDEIKKAAVDGLNRAKSDYEKKYKDMLFNISAVIGAIDDEMAVQFKEKSLCLYAKFDGPIRVLVDLNKAGKQTTLARNVWTDLCNQGERPVKVALWGLHPVAKLLASFYIGLSGNKKCKFFSTKEAAMKWLKEKI